MRQCDHDTETRHTKRKENRPQFSEWSSAIAEVFLQIKKIKIRVSSPNKKHEAHVLFHSDVLGFKKK